jgi:hypothetical protein
MQDATIPADADTPAGVDNDANNSNNDNCDTLDDLVEYLRVTLLVFVVCLCWV